MNKLDVIEFGRQLIETKDLDPVYVVLWEAGLDEETLSNFLLAYFCFYHLGTASWITTRKHYWTALLAAASTKEHPRASERRHFRGEQAIQAVRELPTSGVQWLDEIKKVKPPTLLNVMMAVRKSRGFGSWIAFKVADILERLDIVPVQFQVSDVFNMYESPRLGAELVHSFDKSTHPDPCLYTYDKIQFELGSMLAPPRYERPINIQEIETILCKYHSYWKGHYKVGKDIEEVRHALVKYRNVPLTSRLLKAGAKGGLW